MPNNQMTKLKVVLVSNFVVLLWLDGVCTLFGFYHFVHQ
jgi:hypothetical protein